MRRRLIGFAVALCLAPLSVTAHEFWIEPTDYTVGENAPLVANIRVGQLFEGSASPYAPINYERFDLLLGDAQIAVTGRIGDRPALNMAIPGEGLVTAIYVTRSYGLTYTEFEKFGNFARHKDFVWALDAHRDRGLPTERFKESYKRFGKSLIALGAGAGADQAIGLEVEIVALANPYTDTLNGTFPVRVSYQGKPVSNGQVEVFEKAPGGEVQVSLFRTNADGTAMIDVRPGHAYLVDHVVLREIDPDTRPDGAVWESLWASLTFEVPK